MYSSSISPYQPARANQSHRLIYELRSDGTGYYFEHGCDGELSEETEFEWSVESEVDRRVRRTAVAPDGSTGFVFWELPEPCDAGARWRAVDERGNPSWFIEPGRYCNPQLSNYNSLDDSWECDFELCGDLPAACVGAEE